MAAESAPGGHPLGHNGCQQRAEALAGAVNKIKVTIVIGEVGRGFWVGGKGGGSWRRLELREKERKKRRV